MVYNRTSSHSIGALDWPTCQHPSYTSMPRMQRKGEKPAKNSVTLKQQIDKLNSFLQETIANKIHTTQLRMKYTFLESNDLQSCNQKHVGVSSDLFHPHPRTRIDLPEDHGLVH